VEEGANVMMLDEYHLVDVDGISVTVDRGRVARAEEWYEPGDGRRLRIYSRPNEVVDVAPTDHLRSWLPCRVKSLTQRPL
jgi:hypothetical protein